MYSGLFAAIILSATVVFFVIYKRSMLVRLFSLDMKNQVDVFEGNIQNTADLAVGKIVDASDNLAELLADAQETIEELKLRTKIAEEQLYRISINEIKRGSEPSENNIQQSPLFTATTGTFQEQLAKASYKTAPHLDDRTVLFVPQVHKPVVEEQQLFDEEPKIKEEPVLQNVVEDKKIKPQENSLPNIDMKSAEPKFKQKQILKLVANGYDDMYIAKTLKLGIGEVKLTRKLGKD